MKETNENRLKPNSTTETGLLCQILNIEDKLGQRCLNRENSNTRFISPKIIELDSLDNNFLKRVRTVVQNNLMNENFGMECLAEELMLSRGHLHRKIKSILGATTSEFVNLVRIKKAVELIENYNYRFNEVAYRVGFSSQPYFNKCFKNVYGVAPKEYFSNRNDASGRLRKHLYCQTFRSYNNIRKNKVEERVEGS